MLNHHLKTFIITADCGSFTKAGSRLFISPNAVAKQINLLEQHLKLTLFIRSSKGLKLTPEGAYIYKETKELLLQSEKIMQKARQISASESTIIRVGTSLMTPCQILQNLWLKAADHAPDITIQIEPCLNDAVEFQNTISHLGEMIDVIPCLYDDRFFTGNCRILHLTDQAAEIGVPPRHPLSQKRKLFLSDLAFQSVLMMNADTNPALFQIKKELLDRCPGIQVEEIPFMSYHIFNRAVNENKLLITSECWRNVHPVIKNLPVEWDYTFPYGVIYPLKAKPGILRFIDLLRTV